MENYKITIPKPCHENWNKMTPNETGRFCNQCSKSVVDFSNMETSEIQFFFNNHKGQKICGRFKTKQLDTIAIQIPRSIIFNQIHFHKMFLLALVITMGTTLLSCSDTDGNKQKIDKVEVVSDEESYNVGEPAYHEDSIQTSPEAPKSITDQVKFPPPSKVTKTKSTNEITRPGTISGDIQLEPILDSIPK